MENGDGNLLIPKVREIPILILQIHEIETRDWKGELRPLSNVGKIKLVTYYFSLSNCFSPTCTSKLLFILDMREQKQISFILLSGYHLQQTGL